MTTPTHKLVPVEPTDKPSEILDWLETEVTAIDCMYHGSPTYERTAYWMRDEVVRLIDQARKAFPDITAFPDAPTSTPSGSSDRDKTVCHSESAESEPQPSTPEEWQDTGKSLYLVSALVQHKDGYGHRANVGWYASKEIAIGCALESFQSDTHSVISYDATECTEVMNGPWQASPSSDDGGKLREALEAARRQLITLGGDTRKHILENSTVSHDEVQAAVLDLIDAAIGDPQ